MIHAVRLQRPHSGGCSDGVRGTMRITMKTLEVRGGTMAYRCNEMPGAPALVFVHGLGGDSKLFHNQLRFFGRNLRVIAVDLPGHGKSRWNTAPGIEDYVSSVMEVMEHESIRECVLVGHSMGGGVCLDLQSRIDGLLGMVLISAGAVLPVARELFDMLERDVDFFIDYFVTATFSQNAALLSSFAKIGFGEQERATVKRDLEICKTMDYSPVLPGIGVPVLIIANRGDRVVPPHITAFLADRIPGSRYIEFDCEGHIPHFDHKDMFNRAVTEFISGVIPNISL
jgi:pimeloyl-ACP methyl ester carboxylesterase